MLREYAEILSTLLQAGYVCRPCIGEEVVVSDVVMRELLSRRGRWIRAQMNRMRCHIFDETL